MFRIIQQTLRTGIVTTGYPRTPAQVPAAFRGKPVFDFEHWRDARPAVDVCPTEAISLCDSGDSRTDGGLWPLRLLWLVRRSRPRRGPADHTGIRARDARSGESREHRGV